VVGISAKGGREREREGTRITNQKYTKEHSNVDGDERMKLKLTSTFPLHSTVLFSTIKIETYVVEQQSDTES
jgi:hypothetical protein